MRARKESHDRPQTLKQAKKAFKARGPTSVSDQERRRLERGAQLLERASRIKEQEQRRKDQLRRKEEASVKDSLNPAQHAQHPLLGTQRKLDKFGYKSSQLHLGAFLKNARPVVVAAEEQRKQNISAEPWDDDSDSVDDNTLLDIVDESSCQRGKQGDVPAGQQLPSVPLSIQHTSFLIGGNDLDHWDDFLESSTQLARELSNEKPMPPQKPAPCVFSSFGSTDFDLSSEDIEALDASLHDPEPPVPENAIRTADKAKAILPPPPSPPKHNFGGHGSENTTIDPHDPSLRLYDGNFKTRPAPSPFAKPMLARDDDRKLMPPPALPRPKPLPKTAGVTASEVSPKQDSGISLADLESLANEDVQLTQYLGS